EGKPFEEKLLINKKADLLGSHVAKAYAFFEHNWGVQLEFDSIGATQFDDLAAAHVNEQFAILLDGVVQSAPVIKTTYFGGRASITGNFTEQQARNLSSVLENPLATPVAIEETRSASATLG